MSHGAHMLIVWFTQGFFAQLLPRQSLDWHPFLQRFDLFNTVEAELRRQQSVGVRSQTSIRSFIVQQDQSFIFSSNGPRDTALRKASLFFKSFQGRECYNTTPRAYVSSYLPPSQHTSANFALILRHSFMQTVQFAQYLP